MSVDFAPEWHDRIVALDFETAASYDHVVEIGCVEIKSGRLTGREFHRLIQPIVSVDPFCEAVHGISNSELLTKPFFSVVADDFLDFIGDAHILAHSEHVERTILMRELGRLGRTVFERNRFICTCQMARRSGRFAKNGLRNVCMELGILEQPLREGRHDALVDARMCGHIYLHLHLGCAA